MSAWVPLFQSLVWPLFILTLVCLFKVRLFVILDLLQHRIERGSKVKAGGFELGEIPSQSQDEQKNKLIEAAEQVSERPSSAPTDPSRMHFLKASAVERLVVAEDLALRELQTEYGVSISRQVSLGSDMHFDGLFTQQGTAFAIEVKYLRDIVDVGGIKDRFIQIQKDIRGYGWRRFTIIFVVIYDDLAIDRVAEQRRLEGELSSLGEFIIVRVYSLLDLLRKYGVQS